MTTRPVVVKAIAEIAAQQGESEAEQLDLLPSRFEPGTPEHEEQRTHAKRGRPRGAGNIAQRDQVAFIRRAYGDPLDQMARWLLHSPDSLARELGCTKVHAFELQQRIREFLAQFMYARKAPVDGEGNAITPMFNMVIGGRSSAANDQPPWIYEGGPAIEQNQQVSEAEPDVSHGDVSHGEPK
jgi:hypothetical protein